MAWICCGLAVTTYGVEWKSDAHRFAVELPSGWNELDAPRKDVKVAAQKPDASWTVVVAILPSGGARELTPRFISGFKKGFEAKGGRIKSEQLFDLNGRPTCELEGRSTVAGANVRTQMRITIVDKQVYQLLALGPADEELDASVKPFFDSFRVLGQRTPLAAASSSGPADSSEVPANRIAYLLGRIVGFCVAGGVLIGAIVGFFVFIVKIAGKKRPPPIPPPNFSW